MKNDTASHSINLVDATCQMLDGDLTAASGEATPTLSAWRGILLAEGMIELHQELGNLKNALEAGNGAYIKQSLATLAKLTRDAAASGKDSELNERLSHLANCLHDGANSISQDQSDMINSAHGPELPTGHYNQGDDGVQRNATEGPTSEYNANPGPGQGSDANEKGHPSQAEGDGKSGGADRSGDDTNRDGHPSQAEGEPGNSSQLESASKAARGSYELNMDAKH